MCNNFISLLYGTQSLIRYFDRLVLKQWFILPTWRNIRSFFMKKINKKPAKMPPAITHYSQFIYVVEKMSSVIYIMCPTDNHAQ